jgi:hypothetical protein
MLFQKEEYMQFLEARDMPPKVYEIETTSEMKTCDGCHKYFKRTELSAIVTEYVTFYLCAKCFNRPGLVNWITKFGTRDK